MALFNPDWCKILASTCIQEIKETLILALNAV